MIMDFSSKAKGTKKLSMKNEGGKGADSDGNRNLALDIAKGQQKENHHKIAQKRTETQN